MSSTVCVRPKTLETVADSGHHFVGWGQSDENNVGASIERDSSLLRVQHCSVTRAVFVHNREYGLEFIGFRQPQQAVARLTGLLRLSRRHLEGTVSGRHFGKIFAGKSGIAPYAFEYSTWSTGISEGPPDDVAGDAGYRA